MSKHPRNTSRSFTTQLYNKLYWAFLILLLVLLFGFLRIGYVNHFNKPSVDEEAFTPRISLETLQQAYVPDYWHDIMVIPKPAPEVQLAAYPVIITAYTSRPEETDDTPFETATMTLTRPGVVAVSRDFLQSSIPYRSLVEIVNEGGPRCGGWELGTEGIFPELFVVEDTMHARKTNQVDVWMPHLEDALQWGICQGWVIVHEHAGI